MKDQYFGDVNDYRKYGLLRGLAGGGRTSIAVCWMLTPSDGSTDGRFVQYLEQPGEYWRFDPPLYTFLQDTLVRRDVREVAALHGTDLLPGTRYWAAPTPDAPFPRRDYLREFLAFADGADLVFFDPDNGMQVQSVPFGRRNSSKYLYWREVRTTFERGHSLLIYQHFPRVEREAYTARLAAELADRCDVPAVTSLATSRVVFFLVPQPEHGDALGSAVGGIRGTWQGQFAVREHRFDR